MELPNVDNLAVDEQAGVQYNVKAYRQLSSDELLQIIRNYLGGIRNKKKRPKRGDCITIVWIGR